MRAIIPFLGLGMTVVMIIAYIIMNKNEKKKVKENNKGNTGNIAQTFINILDIHDNILYGLDDYKRVFIEIEGICIDLLNKNDIKRIIRELSSEISKLNIEFDLFCISRPFNIDTLKQQYEDDILNAKTDIQRTLLRNSLKQILAFGENGEVTERKFYMMVQGQDSEPEIEKQADLLMECFKTSNLTCYRLKNNEIKRLINLFNNMTTYNYDNLEDTTNSIPVIKEDLQKEKTIDEKLQEKLEKEKKEQERIYEELKRKEKEENKKNIELVNEIKDNDVKSTEKINEDENVSTENVEEGEENGEEKNED